MTELTVIYGPGDGEGWTAEVERWHYDDHGNVRVETVTGVKHVVSGESDWFITEGPDE